MLPVEGIQAHMQLPPSPAVLGTMLRDQPFAGPVQLYTAAVHQQLQRLKLAFGIIGIVTLLAHRSETAKSIASSWMMELTSPSVRRSVRAYPCRSERTLEEH